MQGSNQKVICGLIKRAMPSALITLLMSFSSVGRTSEVGKRGRWIWRHWLPHLYMPHIKGDPDGVSLSPPTGQLPGLT